MSEQPSRTALVVVADVSDPSLVEARRRWVVPDRGIPPHLTVLFPFVAVPALDDGTLEALHDLYATTSPFDYALTSVESFPDAVWLAPSPDAPFVELIATTCAAFPDYPPYGDNAFWPPVPHCTVRVLDDGEEHDAALTEMRSWFEPHLPIRCRAESVTLLEEGAHGMWSRRHEFPFRGAT